MAVLQSPARCAPQRPHLQVGAGIGRRNLEAGSGGRGVGSGGGGGVGVRGVGVALTGLRHPTSISSGARRRLATARK